MINSTNSSDYELKYEYYYDYLEPVFVDERKMKFNKYSVVIIFWISMAAFVVFLFIFLMHLSRSASGSQTSAWVPGQRSRIRSRSEGHIRHYLPDTVVSSQK